MRDSSSSCGSGGVLAKVISGLRPVPWTMTLASSPWTCACGVDVEQRIGRAFAAEADDAAVEPEVAAGEIIIAADEVGAAGEARRVGQAADLRGWSSSGC